MEYLKLVPSSCFFFVSRLAICSGSKNSIFFWLQVIIKFLSLCCFIFLHPFNGLSMGNFNILMQNKSDYIWTIRNDSDFIVVNLWRDKGNKYAKICIRLITISAQLMFFNWKLSKGSSGGKRRKTAVIIKIDQLIKQFDIFTSSKKTCRPTLQYLLVE